MSVIGRPNGLAQLLSLGDPHAYLLRDGNVDEEHWQAKLNLVVIDFPQPLPLSYSLGTFAHATRCHPVAATSLRRTFAQLHGADLWPLLRTFGGGYKFRLQRGSDSKISVHSWGLAFDFDVLNNKLGDVPKMDPRIVDCFELNGFIWGGRFAGRLDGMHFQYCEGY